uniref:ARAD1C42482p n=1 Tax=Blastobotrys adeninivorans TaxID=409370 RepID=A0A060T3T0_BLAAD
MKLFKRQASGAGSQLASQNDSSSPLKSTRQRLSRSISVPKLNNFSSSTTAQSSSSLSSAATSTTTTTSSSFLPQLQLKDSSTSSFSLMEETAFDSNYYSQSAGHDNDSSVGGNTDVEPLATAAASDRAARGMARSIFTHQNHQDNQNPQSTRSVPRSRSMSEMVLPHDGDDEGSEYESGNSIQPSPVVIGGPSFGRDNDQHDSGASSAQGNTKTSAGNDDIDSLARNYWQYLDASASAEAANDSHDSHSNNPSQPHNKDQEEEDDDDEPLYGESTAPSSRVKSMFPSLNFYKPVGNGYRGHRPGTRSMDHDNDPDAQKSLINDGNDNSTFYDPGSASLHQQQQNQEKSLSSPPKSKTSRFSRPVSKTFSRRLVFSTEKNGEASHADSNVDDQDNGPQQQAPQPRSRRSLNPMELRSSLPPRNDSDDSDDHASDEEDDTLLPLAPLVPPGRDSHPTAIASRDMTGNMVMTKSQLESYRRSRIETGVNALGSKRVGAATEDDGGDEAEDDDNDYADDVADDDIDQDGDEDGTRRADRFDDDADDKKKSIRMRLKQDAHLSVYRQKMSKVTGSQTALSSYNLPLRQSQSMMGLDDFEDESEDDEYDNVPLGILQAHGFPHVTASNKIRGSQSNPNLAALNNSGPAPSVLYQPGTLPPPQRSPDAMSTKSGDVGMGNRTDRASMPPLPSVFNSQSTSVHRGLVGEIAKEEEAKMRRKSLGMSMMLNSAGQRSSTLLDQIPTYAQQGNGSMYTPSMYNESNGSDSHNGAKNGGQNNEMQQMMQQMMQMQMQMIQQMNQQQQAPHMYGGAPHQQPSFVPPMKKSWSTYDMLPTGGRPPSIRSFTPDLQQNGNGNANGVANGGGPRHDRTNSHAISMFRQTFAGPSVSASQHRPAPPADDSDEDDDDAAWQEMLRKRQNLKAMWKNNQQVAT